MQKITSCMNCELSIPRSLDVNYCRIAPGKFSQKERAYMQNKDGLTETCPMWDKAVDVSE